MSGIEILGIAASVLQIADLGGKLSVRLFTFSRKIKNADKNIETISRDIAVTGAVLQELGSELEKDGQLGFCSKKAVETAEKLITDCHTIFKELNEALEGVKKDSNGRNIILGWQGRVKWPFLEANIEQLRLNLERLKSSLLVMLNVFILAGQMAEYVSLKCQAKLTIVGRSRNTLPRIIQEQRKLIELLCEDERLSEQKLARLAITPDILDKETDCPPNNNGELGRDPPLTDVALPTDGIFVQVSRSWELAPPKDQPVPEREREASLSRRKEEIKNHSRMIMDLLQQIDSIYPSYHYREDSYPFSYILRGQMGRCLLDVHWKYWSPYRKLYGDDTLLRMFVNHDDVVRSSQPAILSPSRDHYNSS